MSKNYRPWVEEGEGKAKGTLQTFSSFRCHTIGFVIISLWNTEAKRSKSDGRTNERMDVFGLPPATRTYFIGCAATTALVHFDMVSPLYLYLNFNRYCICGVVLIHPFYPSLTPNRVFVCSVWNHMELWRLVSNFFFFDYFSLNWLFHMLFLLPNAASLEKNHFRGKMSHFVWMIFILAVLQSGAALLLYHLNWFRVMFLGPSFSFGMGMYFCCYLGCYSPFILFEAIVYVWSRKSEHIQMNFLGLFVFQVSK